MVTGPVLSMEGSCHSSGRHQIPVETVARRPERSPPCRGSRAPRAAVAETQPLEGLGGWALGMQHTVILDV